MLMQLLVQSIIMSVEMLSKLASLQKLEPAIFELHSRDLLPQLWGMSDRSIRTSLLQTLRHMVSYLDNGMVNKHIFEPMIAGFADSNAKYKALYSITICYYAHLMLVDRLGEATLIAYRQTARPVCAPIPSSSSARSRTS